MAETFTFDFGYDDVDDDPVEEFTGFGGDERSVTIAGEDELLVARPHSMEEMVGRGVVSIFHRLSVVP